LIKDSKFEDMRFIRIELLLLLLVFTSLVDCKKDNQAKQPITITLWDKPLSEIQSYITGNWKLQYSYGGLSVHKVIEKNNSYMLLKPDHILIGNDPLGIVVDTSIVWVKMDIGTNEFTYLLSYSWPGYLWPEHYIVEQIKNDTLVIREYVNDGFRSYYTKYE
jgi:hypothetical protein